MVFVRDTGQKNHRAKSTIILLHGFGMHSSHWLPFVIPLSYRFRFLIPDLRGFGQSHLTDHNQTCVLTNYADDLADIVEHYELNSFKLAGISMGALVALKFLEKYDTKKVSHYLHIDQGPKCMNDKSWRWGLFGNDNSKRLRHTSSIAEKLSPYIDDHTSYDQLPLNLRIELWHDLGDFFSSAMSKPALKRFAKTVCSQEKLISKIMPVKNWPSYIRCVIAYLEQDYDMRAVLEKIEIPISLIVGMKSDMYPCGGQLRIADYSSNCEIIPFENSGHTPLIDQPIRFLKELKHFSNK